MTIPFPLALCAAVVLPFVLVGAALLIVSLCKMAARNAGVTVDEGQAFGGQYGPQDE